MKELHPVTRRARPGLTLLLFAALVLLGTILATFVMLKYMTAPPPPLAPVTRGHVLPASPPNLL